jgi:hypothetical protein
MKPSEISHHLARVMAAVALLLVSQSASGQEAEAADADFQAHLEAGELGLARQMALQTNDSYLRTKRITQVAKTQLAARASEGAWSTLSHLAHGDLTEQRQLRDSLASMRNSDENGEFGSPRLGGRGGAALADFDTLINLIESTVTPDVWETNGGNGAIEPYPAGVYVDATGVLKKIERIDSGALTELRERAMAGDYAEKEVATESSLRFVSLRKLQDAVSRRFVTGEPLTSEMKYLAGIHRAQYVFVDSKNGDILIGGPAGRLAVGESGRMLHVESGDAALHLDDLLVMLRTIESGTPFGCTIEPRRGNLENLQTYLANQGPLKAGRRAAWLKGIQDAVGYQDIRVFGMNGESHAAQVLVEADYHMKRVGIGLEPTVDGVTSYISSIQLDENGNPPPMSVFRCWFVMNYESVVHTADKDAFELTGRGVKLLTENEMLTVRGQRVKTGRSEGFNRQFAESFTEHYARISKKYPVYAELRNVFDLALIATLIREHGLEGSSQLSLDRLRDDTIAPSEVLPVPTEVFSVANLRVIGKRHVIGLVSGGVRVDTRGTAARRIKLANEDKNNTLTSQREMASALSGDQWWWDVR